MTRENKQVLKFGAVVAVLGVVLHFDADHQADRVEDDVVRSCKRVNEVRTEINHRGVVLRKFLNDAARVRERTAALEAEQGEHREAALNNEAADQWREWAGLVRNVKLPNCDSVVKQQGVG